MAQTTQASSPFGRVKFDFTPRYADEIQVRFNDIVRIRQASSVEGWTEVEFQGDTGLLPTEFIEPLSESYEGASAVALYSFSHPKEPESGQFLRFAKGDEVLVVERPMSGWCVGVAHSHVGLFPEGYVQYSAPATTADLEEVRASLQECAEDIFRYFMSLFTLSVTETSKLTQFLPFKLEKTYFTDTI